jgi:hypothetical protein
MEVIISTAKESSKKYGKMGKIEMPNGSKIYVFKKGWGLTPSKKQYDGDLELMMTWGEINLAINLSKELGYVTKSKVKVKS